MSNSNKDTKSIYKFNIDMGFNKITVPEGSDILSAKAQYGSLVLYVAVAGSGEPQTRTVYCTTTGTYIHDYANTMVFIDTVMLRDGSYVVHVFEEV